MHSLHTKFNPVSKVFAQFSIRCQFTVLRSWWVFWHSVGLHTKVITDRKTVMVDIIMYVNDSLLTCSPTIDIWKGSLILEVFPQDHNFLKCTHSFKSSILQHCFRIIWNLQRAMVSEHVFSYAKSTIRIYLSSSSFFS